MATGTALLAIAAVSTVAKIAADQHSAKQQQKVMNARADAKRSQSAEMLDRFEINKDLIIRKGEQVKAGQLGAFASAGVDVTEGTPLVAMENTNRLIAEEITNTARDVNFRASQIQIGANQDIQAGVNARNAANISAGVDLLQFGAKPAAPKPGED